VITSSNAKDEFSSSNLFLFGTTIYAYFFSSFFPSIYGFTLIALLIVIWSIYSIAGYYKYSVIYNYTFPTLLLGLFLISVLIARSQWEINFDSRDLIAEILFLWIIPFLLVSNIRYSKSFELALIKSIKGFFIISTISIALIGLFVGIDFDRSFFFNFRSFELHKNAVAVIYEIQYIYALYSAIQQKRRQVVLIIIGAGFLCFLIIGSKTSLLLMLLITLGLFKRKFIFFGGILLIYGVLHVMIFEVDLESSFRTAYFRRLLWERAWVEITSTNGHLFLGNGPGTFQFQRREYGLYGVLGTHNIILQYLHNYGIIGFSIFVTFYIWIYKRIGFWLTPAGLSFWMFICHSMFDVGWTKSSGFFVCIFLGLALSKK